jgi:hypothetical protein
MNVAREKKNQGSTQEICFDTAKNYQSYRPYVVDMICPACIVNVHQMKRRNVA